MRSCAFSRHAATSGGPDSLLRLGSATSSILSGVSVPTGHAYYHSSGTVPAAKNASAPRGSRERYGNTTEQAISVLTRIQALLREQGLGMQDAVYVRCYLVADPFLNGTGEQRQHICREGPCRAALGRTSLVWL